MPLFWAALCIVFSKRTPNQLIKLKMKPLKWEEGFRCQHQHLSRKKGPFEVEYTHGAKVILASFLFHTADLLLLFHRTYFDTFAVR